MNSQLDIVSNLIKWPKIGDLIDDKLNSFTTYAPWIATASTIPIIMGIKSFIFPILTLMLLFTYFILYLNKQHKTTRPKMGEMQNATKPPADYIKKESQRKQKLNQKIKALKKAEKKAESQKEKFLAQKQIELCKIRLNQPTPLYYFSNFGTVVKNFKGDTPEEARGPNGLNLKPDNILYEYLVGKSLYTMGILLGGATGSGKTVSLTSTVIHPCIKSGSGFLMVEGKGDRPISESIYLMCAEHGREDDFFFFDFASAPSGGFSHSLAPLYNGNAVVLRESLTNIINVMTGENAWVTEKALGFMGGLLFILVVFRDLNILVEPEILPDIKSFHDFENHETKALNLTLLSKYLNFQSAIDLVYCFRTLVQEGGVFTDDLKDLSKKYEEQEKNKSDDKNTSLGEDEHLYPTQDFVQKQHAPGTQIPGLSELVKAHPKHKTIPNLEDAYLFPLINFLRNHQVDCTDPFSKPVYADLLKESPEMGKANAYAIDPWTEALETFGNPAVYGSIFNKEYPDITILDAIRAGKIVVVSLPSMQNSADKNAKIGKMITSLIKGALGDMLSEGELEGNNVEKEAQKRLRPYKLPYMLIFDEISNYGTDTMGQISSMCRSIGTDNGGIGLMISGQSKSDLDKIGENQIAGRQLIANLGIKYFLNLSDPDQAGYSAFASQEAGKYISEELKQNYIVSKGKNHGDQDDNLQFEQKEKDWFKPEFFAQGLRKQTGEGIINQNGFNRPEKIVATHIEAKPLITNYHGSMQEALADKGIQLSRNISHKKLMSYLTIDTKTTPHNNTNHPSKDSNNENNENKIPKAS